jgi:hypothetical protein
VPNTPTEDIQVENETAETYRGVQIFRTLQRGVIVYAGGQSKKSYPAQTFYAMLPEDMKKGTVGKEKTPKQKLFVSHTIENVRALIDQHAPGTSLVIAPAEAQTAGA